MPRILPGEATPSFASTLLPAGDLKRRLTWPSATGFARQFGLALAITLLLGTLVPPALAQYGLQSRGLIPPSLVRRYGMKRAWYTTAEVDRSRGRLGHLTHHVSATEAYTVFEVKYPDGKLEFSERQLDPFGRPVGVEGAKKLAEDKILEFRDQKIKAELVTHVIPKSTLYVVTDQALVQSIDAETGRRRWLQRVGKRQYPTLAAAANDKFVAVVNGSTLFVLRADTGELHWQRDVVNVPGAGPAISEELIFAPMINGRVEAYYVNDYLRAPYIFASAGRATVQPTVTAASVAWPTDAGHVYVGRANERGIRYRLEANRTVVSRITALAPTSLFATSVDGFVYCIQEVSGQVLWRFSTGESISQSAVAIGESVYAITDSGGMYCLGAADAEEKWWIPNVRGFLAASQDRVYIVGSRGEIGILDAATGGRIGTIPTRLYDYVPVVNGESDRIFIANELGILQCFREERNKFPVLHVESAETDAAKPRVIQQGPAQPAAPVQQPKDPFGGGGAKDPFGGGGAKDPFGGGGGAAGGAAKDPFGGGGAAKDPFGGGGNDPFK